MVELVSLDTYARHEGVSVKDVLYRAASGEITLYWQLPIGVSMRPVERHQRFDPDDGLGDKDEIVWQPCDRLAYGVCPPLRSGTFRLCIEENRLLIPVFTLLAQGRSAYAVDHDDESGNGMVRGSLILEDANTGGCWRIYDGSTGEFEGGRLPTLGELMASCNKASETAQSLTKKRTVVEQRVERIWAWFRIQEDFTRENLFNPREGKPGAKAAAWKYFEGIGLTKASTLFYGTAKQGRGKQAGVFGTAWGAFKKEVEASKSTPEK